MRGIYTRLLPDDQSQKDDVARQHLNREHVHSLQDHVAWQQYDGTKGSVNDGTKGDTNDSTDGGIS